MILLIDKALKCDFFIFIRDQAPKPPLLLEKEINDTCTVANALRGRQEQGSGIQLVLESRWLSTPFMDVGLKQYVPLLLKSLHN